MAYDIAFLVGRIFVGVFFLMNGFNHFMKYNMMKGYASSKNVPAAGLAVVVSGLLLVLGGASILLGVWPTVGVVLLLVFLVPTTLMMHNFWAVGEQEKMNQMIQFMKNTALVGFLLMILAVAQPWVYSLF